jgi:ABC-type phosphate transport system ATPase subunit
VEALGDCEGEGRGDVVEWGEAAALLSDVGRECTEASSVVSGGSSDRLCISRLMNTKDVTGMRGM